jgi:hypothetical protein
MLLFGECYENIYTQRRTDYPSLNVLKDVSMYFNVVFLKISLLAMNIAALSRF